MDWIDTHQQHWRIYRTLREADASTNHWLTVLISSDAYGSRIAAFLA